MKKLLKKIAVALCFVLTCSGFFGCGRVNTDGQRPIDDGKLQLLVGTFGGGIGVEWLSDAISRFEKQYENVRFGDKVGVQVTYDKQEKYKGKIASKMTGWAQHIIFTEEAEYHSLYQKAVDISDVLTTPINQDMITGQTDTSFGTGNESIADIMNPSVRTYFNVGGNDKYYGVPYYESTMGIVYSIDVFEQYGFYYAADGYGDGEGFVQDKQGNWIGQGGKVLGKSSSMTFEQAKAAGLKLGKGPDNKENTDDDGFAQTYDDFYKLCQRIYDRGVIPFTFPGSDNNQYLNQLAYNIWADFEGREQMELNYSMNGTAKDLINISTYNSSNGTYELLPPQTITPEKGYLMQSQEGKLKGIEFIKWFTEKTDYYDTRSQSSQTEAEGLFVTSILPEQKDRAMLIDGTWWQSEASGTFKNMVSDYQKPEYGIEYRRYGMMPLPKDPSKVGEKTTLAYNNENFMVLNKTAIDAAADSENVLKAAKQFVKFLHTHESFYRFNRITSTARPFDYELTDDELATFTSVGKENYKLHDSVDFVFTYSQNDIVKNTPQLFCSAGDMVFQMANGQDRIISTTFFNGKCGSAWDYFKSVVDHYNKTYWDTNFSVYF